MDSAQPPDAWRGDARSAGLPAAPTGVNDPVPPGGSVLRRTQLDHSASTREHVPAARAAFGGHTQQRPDFSSVVSPGDKERVSWVHRGPGASTAQPGVRSGRTGRAQGHPSAHTCQPRRPEGNPSLREMPGPRVPTQRGLREGFENGRAVGSGMYHSASQPAPRGTRAHSLGACTPPPQGRTLSPPRTSHIPEASSWETPVSRPGPGWAQEPLSFLGEQPRGRPSQPPSGSDDADVHHRVCCAQTRPLSMSTGPKFRCSHLQTGTKAFSTHFQNAAAKPRRKKSAGGGGGCGGRQKNKTQKIDIKLSKPSSSRRGTADSVWLFA